MDYRQLFPSLPDEARCWVYVSLTQLSSSQQEALLQGFDEFVREWTTHGRPVSGEATIVADQVLLVAGHAEDGISGCGIDSSVRAVKSIADELDVIWSDPLNIVYRTDDDTVEVMARPAFREHVRKGVIGPETPVFDLSVTLLGEVRQGRFERPAHESWHARVFKIPNPA